jgi:hypothetical protein
MPTRSQRHLREIQGVDSSGQGPGNVSPPAGAIAQANGDTVTPALIVLSGVFPAGNISCSWVTDVPSGGSAATGAQPADTSAGDMAIALAASFDANGDLTAVAVGDTVEVLASGSAATVTLNVLSFAPA